MFFLCSSLPSVYSCTGIPSLLSSSMTLPSLLGTTAYFISSKLTTLSGFASNKFTGIDFTSLIKSAIFLACTSFIFQLYGANVLSTLFSVTFLALEASSIILPILETLLYLLSVLAELLIILSNISYSLCSRSPNISCCFDTLKSCNLSFAAFISSKLLNSVEALALIDFIPLNPVTFLASPSPCASIDLTIFSTVNGKCNCLKLLLFPEAVNNSFPLYSPESASISCAIPLSHFV